MTGSEAWKRTTWCYYWGFGQLSMIIFNYLFTFLSPVSSISSHVPIYHLHDRTKNEVKGLKKRLLESVSRNHREEASHRNIFYVTKIKKIQKLKSQDSKLVGHANPVC